MISGWSKDSLHLLPDWWIGDPRLKSFLFSKFNYLQKEGGLNIPKTNRELHTLRAGGSRRNGHGRDGRVIPDVPSSCLPLVSILSVLLSAGTVFNGACLRLQGHTDLL